ncbi:MAG: cellulase family glycosylhydrolase [Bacteroidales bacterium]|nr:cellulase family glycosylhydrolase [Clostridium sp.]MCM1202889.1 cellulase family glycosylhydrolase [Bacteroidales bacterium]
MKKTGKKIILLAVLIMAGILAMGQETWAATAVAENGALAVSGTKLVSKKSGREVTLRGVSTHGINWDVGYPYISKAAFKTLRDSYGVNAVRLAMYTTEYYGYCDKGSAAESQEAVQETLKQRIDDGVKAASSLGMYVIIDWHVLNDKNPLTYKQQAKAFFTEMSKKYAGYDNVIYEICNEPNGGTSWDEIKTYAKSVIPAIRKNDSDAVIIVGTPNWSQDVDVASNSPLPYENVMYTLHFYSATHMESYRDKLRTALANGLPVMVTEFGISEASGAGAINQDEAKKWLDLLDENKISYFAWSLSNKDESASLLSAGSAKLSGWKNADLSPAGKWVLGQYKQRSGAAAAVTKPGKVTKLSLKNVKGRKVKVTFKTVSGADGYQILYGTNKQFKKAKEVYASKPGRVIKKLKKGKTYYVKVRAYKKVKGEKRYGSYSQPAKIKIKK